MNWPLFYDMQRALDERIETEHGLMEEDLFARKQLAFLVELGELANETRCFKFWSIKPPAPAERVLEEYVDGLHFLLSLGLECGLFYQENEAPSAGRPLVEQFLAVFRAAERFGETRARGEYDALFAEYWRLGVALGFSSDDIEAAYRRKNEVNHKRQDHGY
ncbi:dUTP diphosphatase [Geobacillus stearothermophilus]|uniref:dUTP diphosphatase n=3 Tax=Geobacillus stearothermophilus TaxID=1422 RepID=UPI002E1E3273|nr:dUTP diphosphatase [Geobacillus stearothermophilus]MED3740136.1 dUTP diphosphatase [Geobacillus stearothermophilus]MED3765991.1 dUTP diphosphatase [Geobacillus stearothermophilus]MED3773708.1 dUTP diphosphatase [Geobacillus stearothermophilus]